MTAKEKLVELLDIIIQPGRKTLGDIANYLIANGVTVQEVLSSTSSLPISDAILILREELRQKTDGYYTYLVNGGKADCAEEVYFDALEMAIAALEKQKPLSEPPKGELG